MLVLHTYADSMFVCLFVCLNLLTGLQRQVRHPFLHNLLDCWQTQRHLFISESFSAQQKVPSDPPSSPSLASPNTSTPPPPPPPTLCPHSSCGIPHGGSFVYFRISLCNFFVVATIM